MDALYRVEDIPSISSAVSALILCDASFPRHGPSLTRLILESDLLQVSRIFVQLSLSWYSVLSMNSGSLGLSRLLAPTFHLREYYTLVPPP